MGEDIPSAQNRIADVKAQQDSEINKKYFHGNTDDSQ